MCRRVSVYPLMLPDMPVSNRPAMDPPVAASHVAAMRRPMCANSVLAPCPLNTAGPGLPLPALDLGPGGRSSAAGPIYACIPAHGGFSIALREALCRCTKSTNQEHRPRNPHYTQLWCMHVFPLGYWWFGR